MSTRPISASAKFAARGVSIDTRTLAKDDLFCAIEGVSQDGHQFVSAAFKAGAAAALVQTGRIAKPEGPVVEVADTLEALRGLGRAARARSKARIAAVTQEQVHAAARFVFRPEQSVTAQLLPAEG